MRFLQSVWKPVAGAAAAALLPFKHDSKMSRLELRAPGGHTRQRFVEFTLSPSMAIALR